MCSATVAMTRATLGVMTVENDLLLILDALQEAQYYRFDDEAGVTEACGDCHSLRVEANDFDDPDILCEDHISDKAIADSYADVAMRLISVVTLPKSGNETEAPTL